MERSRPGWLRVLGAHAAVLLVLCAPAARTLAVPPLVPPDRFLEVEGLAAHARELLFLLGYALQPACGERGNRWSAGVGAVGVRGEAAPASRTALLSDVLQKKFGAQPGQGVFVSDQPLTSYGIAGVRAGDIFDVPRSKAPDEDSPPAPAPPPEGSRSKRSLLEQLEALNKRLAALKKFMIERDERIYSADPIRKLTIIRGSAEIPARVRMVRVCDMDLRPVDSANSYAESDNGVVYITAAMLRSLSHVELVAVLSHEAAHVALGLSKDRSKDYRSAKLVFGVLAAIGANAETETRAPKDADLILADRLAMRVAEGLGVEPTVYAESVTKLVAASAGGMAPEYERTRPMNPERADALQRSVQFWTQAQHHCVPRGIDAQQARTVHARARAAWKTPETAFSAVDLRDPVAPETEGNDPPCPD